MLSMNGIKPNAIMRSLGGMVLLMASFVAGQMTTDPSSLPPDARSAFITSMEAQKAGNNTLAVEKYNTVIAASPDFAPAHFNLGLALDALGQFEAALAQFHRVAGTLPEFPAVQLFLGIENERLQHHAAAAQALAAATSQNPQDLQAWFWLGKARLAMDQLDPAESAARHALTMDTHQPGARFLLAQIDIARSDWESARKALQALIADFPDLPGAHEALGGVYYSLAQRALAMSEYEKELKVDSGNLKANSMIGVLMVENGEFQKAVPYLAQGVAANPQIALLQHKLGQALLQTSSYDQALPHLEAAAKLDANNAGVHFLLWKLYKQTGKTAEADAELQIFKRLEKNGQLRSYQ